MAIKSFRLILFFLICIFIPVTASAQVVSIPDFNLRAVIENKLGKAPGATITVVDMAWITDLDGTNRNIRNLTGLEHATNLIQLWLPENNITDLRPLSGLTRLIELDLLSNSISDISPLARLINLRGLYLRDNYIFDLSPLAGLTQLRYLNLGENRIFSILFLRGLTQLEELGLWTNSIDDISPLARLTNLRLLDLGENAITNISALAGLINLSELWIDNNSISDISPLVANTGIGSGDEVNVQQNPLSALSFSRHIPTLQSRGVTVEFDHIVVPPATVHIPDPNLRKVIEQGLRKAGAAIINADEMASLQVLDATNRNIYNLTGLEYATNLKELWLRYNVISDLSPLAGLTRLTLMDLRDNSISDISPLARLTHLEVLGLARNNITNISPLAGLKSLRELGLGQNNITNISPLAGLVQLEVLWLPDNSILNISPLARVSRLTELHLANNSISDLWPLVANTGLGRGDTVNVKGNLLSAISIHTHIPTLQNRGVTVEFGQTAVAVNTVNIPDPNLRNAIEHVLGKARGTAITVADMERLAALYTTSENIRNLTGLEHATNLTELGLVDNSITDISPLAGLTKLRLLWLDNNSVSNISAIAGLINLTDLRLLNNAISDLSPLIANTGLGSGDWIDVRGNFLNNVSINNYIPTLQNRGIVVEFDQIVVLPQTVNIPDSNLRNAIEQVLGKVRGAVITAADMSILTTLHAPKKNIRNLTGLEHATNLIELGLGDNAISDISTVSRLTNLTLLDLRDNSISDISPLAGLTNLTALGLGKNNIRNISPLAGLPRLTALNLWENVIADISPLARLTNLTALRLDTNFISDISPLARLTRLTELYLENNSISDLWPLVANTGLGRGDTVNVRGNPLSTVSFTTHLATLRSRGVTVEFDQIVVVPPPPPQSVNIPDPNIRHAIRKALGKARDAVIGIEDMARLTELEVIRKTVTNLTGLEHATNLTKLVLRNNAIADISPLVGLTQLTFLHLGSNRISNISLLARFTQLRQLYLEKNTISNISPLAGLTNLTTLELGHNNIRDISPLARLTNLTELGLRNNSISNISPLERLTNLTELYLENNSISDISPLVANTGLGSGDKLNVRGNPLSNRSFSTHTPTLQNRGVNVESDQIAVSPKTVNIPDPNFRNAIEQLLGKARGATITVSDMQTLAALYTTSKNIRNLIGLKHATNLRELGLDNNSISDISAIAGLPQLSYLNLENNSISDISPLVANTGLGNGDTVNLKGNPLNTQSINTHIPTLQNRGVTVEFDQIVVPPTTVNIPDPNLRDAIERVLGKAPGANITVADMERLTVLNAINEDITDLTGLETATQLTVIDLRNNRISDISPIAGLTNLIALRFARNKIADISPVVGLTSLIELNLRENSISDISPIARLTNLRSLWLNINSIFDLVPLVENTGLGNGDSVDVRGNPLSVVSINTHIPALQSREIIVEFDQIVVPPQTVNIPDSGLRKEIEQTLHKAPGAIITVADMQTLTVLHATHKNITNLTGLETATNLRELDLWNNSISDISPLAGLTRLEYLDLGVSSISDLSPLVGLTRLGYLNLEDNSISDISPVAGLPQLSALNLQNNSISDISPIVENRRISAGHEVYLKGNPLSTLSINTHIPTLQSRGVIVEFDDIVTRPADVNGDGVVNIFDLVSAVSRFGEQGQNLAADVNGDGVVNIFDLVVIAGMFDGAAAAPSAQSQPRLTATEVQRWLTDVQSLEIKNPIMKRGIMVLEQLLISLTPTETRLLPNYPNPFNPETWIPYRLADDAFVTLTIYDGAGQVVRRIDVGHQTAAAYESRSKAIYWDGRNEIGEPVASGVYFYHLSAGAYSATRKMLIVK